MIVLFMQFKTILKKFMKQNSLSANEAAFALGTSRRNIFLWKSGKHQPPIKKWERLAEKMEV